MNTHGAALIIAIGAIMAIAWVIGRVQQRHMKAEMEQVNKQVDPGV